MAGIPENAMQDSDPDMKKDQKASKPRKPPANIGFLAEGIFSWDVEGAELSESSLFSPYHIIGGARFRIGCKTESRGRSLVANLYCNDDASENSSSTKFINTLSITSLKNYDWRSVASFDPRIPRQSSIVMSTVDSKNRNILKGRFTLEAKIKVIGCFKDSFIDFASPDAHLSDVALLVGGKKFYTSKMFLAQVSGYFKALFCSDFAEKNEKEIELEEINDKDFEEMLHFIYPQRKQITAATVASQLRMADFFDVPSLRKECEQFLQDNYSLPMEAKLKLAEEFRLERPKTPHEKFKSEYRLMRYFWSPNFPADQSIDWAVKVDAIGSDFAYSDTIFIDGFPFRIGCKAVTMNNKNWLVIGLFCAGSMTSKMFSVKVECGVELAFPTDPLTKHLDVVFHPMAYSESCRFEWPYSVFAALANGSFTIKARINVLSFFKNGIISPDPDLSDVTLLVGGKKIPINIKYLAHYSGYFKDLSNSGSGGKKMDHSLPEGIVADEFDEMLAVIYPQRKKVCAGNVIAMLRMAEFFDVPVLIRECTEYLKMTRDIPLATKLKLTDKFRLPELQCHLVDSIHRNPTLAIPTHLYSKGLQKFIMGGN